MFHFVIGRGGFGKVIDHNWFITMSNIKGMESWV